MVVRGQGFACEIRWAVREIIALLRIVLLAGLLSGGLAVRSQPVASAPRVSEFAWVGSVAALEPGSLVRIALPPDALTRLQSRAGHDVRVFNAAGDVLPYALTGAQTPVRAGRGVQTRAFPLTSLSDGALADLRSEVQLLAALDLKGVWPRNVLLHMQVAVTDNLQDWTPVPVRGPVYRFDGADPPVNTVLEFEQPLSVEGRFLRIRWPGQAGVRLVSLTGQVAGVAAVPAPVRVPLGAGSLDSSSGRVWLLPFATPARAAVFELSKDAAPVPLRISARSAAASDWKLLASTVVYRSPSAGGQGSPPAQSLPDADIGYLRVEPGNGIPLPEGGVRLALDLAPLQLLFRTAGPGPYTVVAGRAATSDASVALEQLIPGPAMVPDIVPLRPVKQLRAVLPGAPQLWAASLMSEQWAVRGPVFWAALVAALAVAMGAVVALSRLTRRL
ncbi:Protein of unknown function DUF3999 [Comamonadaceae bacterium]